MRYAERPLSFPDSAVSGNIELEPLELRKSKVTPFLKALTGNISGISIYTLSGLFQKGCILLNTNLEAPLFGKPGKEEGFLEIQGLLLFTVRGEDWELGLPVSPVPGGMVKPAATS